MNTLTVGTYVTYKNTPFITCAVENGMAKILSIKGDNVAKLHVSLKNLTIINARPAKVVEYRMAGYLVTGKGVIISLATNRVMKWGDENGDRKAILSLTSL